MCGTVGSHSYYKTHSIAFVFTNHILPKLASKTQKSSNYIIQGCIAVTTAGLALRSSNTHNTNRENLVDL